MRVPLPLTSVFELPGGRRRWIVFVVGPRHSIPCSPLAALGTRGVCSGIPADMSLNRPEHTPTALPSPVHC